MNKFIYFPSFSTGGFAARLQKDYKLKNGLPIIEPFIKDKSGKWIGRLL